LSVNHIAQSTRIDLEGGPVWIHSRDHAVAVRIGFADVAGHANGNVELAVRAEGDEFAPVVPVGREAVGHDGGLRRVGEAALDVIEPQDPRHGRNVERAIVKCHARRFAQSRRDDAHERLATRTRRRQSQRIDVAGRCGADEQRAAGAPGHRPGVGDTTDEFDREPLRQPDLFQRQGLLRMQRCTEDGAKQPDGGGCARTRRQNYVRGHGAHASALQ
jgi:hypothetical protein